jgi:hypothetical protein
MSKTNYKLRRADQPALERAPCQAALREAQRMRSWAQCVLDNADDAQAETPAERAEIEEARQKAGAMVREAARAVEAIRTALQAHAELLEAEARLG